MRSRVAVQEAGWISTARIAGASREASGGPTPWTAAETSSRSTTGSRKQPSPKDGSSSRSSCRERDGVYWARSRIADTTS